MVRGVYEAILGSYLFLVILLRGCLTWICITIARPVPSRHILYRLQVEGRYSLGCSPAQCLVSGGIRQSGYLGCLILLLNSSCLISVADKELLAGLFVIDSLARQYVAVNWLH